MTLVPFSSTTSGDNTILPASEDLFVRGTTLLASTGAVGVAANLGSHAITVMGEVFGDAAGIELGDGTVPFMNSRVAVGIGGSVNGRSIGITSEGSSISIVNSGYIQGNVGIDHNTGSSFTLLNNGTIAGTFGDALNVDSSFGQVKNYGYIVSSFSGNGVNLTNSVTDGVVPSLVNYGFISGYFSGVRSFGSDEADIRNFGEIRNGISTSSGDDFVLNAGTISGDISLSSGDDRFINRGLADGDVSLGSGNDHFDGRGELSSA